MARYNLPDEAWTIIHALVIRGSGVELLSETFRSAATPDNSSMLDQNTQACIIVMFKLIFNIAISKNKFNLKVRNAILEIIKCIADEIYFDKFYYPKMR